MKFNFVSFGLHESSKLIQMGKGYDKKCCRGIYFLLDLDICGDQRPNVEEYWTCYLDSSVLNMFA